MKAFCGWILGTFFITSLTFAQGQGLVGKVGFDRGGVVLGGEYFVNDTAIEGFAGYLSIHQKDDATASPAMTAIGGAFKLSQQFGPYNVFMSPGLGVVDYELGEDDGLLIGPKISYGLLAELDPSLSIGFENQKVYSWVGDVEGLLSDTFLLTIMMGI